MSNPEKNQNSLPDWIKQLRSQSWQIEILIAGSTVYTLFYLSDHIKSFFYSIYPGIDFNLAKVIILFGVYLVTRILLIGFAANLIIRAVWLAYLGINFAFPSGVNFDKLKNNQESKDLLKKQPTILDRVAFLERLSKLSYSISILLAIFMTSVFISTLIIHVFLEYIGFGTVIYEAWFTYTVAILIAVIQLGIIDQFFLSSKSKRPIVNIIKRKLSIVLEYVTLSFLFRREFLAIKSNTNRWALGLSTMLIGGLATFISAYQIGEFYLSGTFNMTILDERKFYDVKYDPMINNFDYMSNLDEAKSIFKASIQNDVIKGKYLKLFVTSWKMFDKKLEHGYKKHNYPLDLETETVSETYEVKVEADSIFNLVINDLFVVHMDGKKIGPLRWKTTIHPKSKTKGYITYIDTEDLKKTEHQLMLYVKYFDRKNRVISGPWKNITFWKE